MGRVQRLLGIASGVLLLAGKLGAQHVEILEGPRSTNVFRSGNATFRVVAAGAEPLTYQWFLEDGAIQGATNSTLTITNVQLTNAGLYHVVVSNVVSWIPSDVARLEVMIRPMMVQHLQSAILLAGETLELSAAVTGHPPPFTFRWRRTINWVAAQTTVHSNATFTIENVGADAAGSWNVAVTNIAGIAPSGPPARIVVVTRAPADQQPILGGTATFSAEVDTGSTTIAYQWQFNATNIPGATSTNLTIAPARPTHAGLYSLTITASTSLPPPVRTFYARLDFTGPPQIATHPASQMVDVHSPVLLKAEAVGSGPISYQWYLNGAIVPDATNPQLAIPRVREQHAGIYKLFITNPLGQVTTDPALLTVRPAPSITAWRGIGPAQATPLTIQSPTPFVLEATTNLFHWTPIYTGSPPIELFIDLHLDLPQRFYRVRR